MNRRPGWLLVPAGAASLLLNLVLFAAAAMLARDRTVPPVEPAPVPVTLISVRPPALPEPEPEPEPPARAEAPPQPDFLPEFAAPGPDRPTAADLKVAVDPRALGVKVDRGEFVFDSQDLDQPPQVIVRTKPEYPFRARQRGLEGFVEVKLLVKADGSVGSVEILESEPEDLFDSAALKAVPDWRFEPGRLDGKPVPSWVRTRVVFTID